MSIVALATLCVGATGYLGYARQDDVPAPLAYRLTLADGSTFTQTVALKPTDSFQVITKIGDETYTVSGTNRPQKDRLSVSISVNKEEIAVRRPNGMNTVRNRSVQTTVVLMPGDKPVAIGGSTTEKPDGLSEKNAFSVSLAAIAKPF